MSDMFSLTGKVILVTGASRGIGAAIARAAAKAGADVAVGFKDEHEAAAAVVGEIRAMGRRATSFAADLTDSGQVGDMVAGVLAEFGAIDGLVNNAGIMPSGPMLEMDDEDWELVLRTNLFGPFFCSRAVLPGMLKRGNGAIVMISSRLGQVGWPELAHYSAAKAGLLGLTKSMAREFGPLGIRVNAVAPGFTITDMTRDLVDSESGRRRLEALPAGRFGEPEDVAASVLFLLSDAAGHHHGQTLNPNGGALMP